MTDTNKVAIDQPDGTVAEQNLTVNGFDLSGMDFLTGGTLYKNMSFLLVPSMDNTGAWGLESANARIDNIGHSPWFNVKFGKFELDNIISEKRILTLSNNGGYYVLYHFIPLGDSNFFGQMGDNQLGMELMGHSLNDRTRYSVALLSSNDGTPNLPSKNAYSTFITASQAFDAGYQGGVDRVGGYLFLGNGPTYSLTSFGDPLTAVGNKPFNREGVFALHLREEARLLAVLPAWLGQRLLRNQYPREHAASAGSAERRRGTVALSKLTTFSIRR